MATGVRQHIKQNLDQSMNLTETIQRYIVANGEYNREVHPEITAQYEILYAYFQEGYNLLASLRSTY